MSFVLAFLVAGLIGLALLALFGPGGIPVFLVMMVVAAVVTLAWRRRRRVT